MNAQSSLTRLMGRVAVVGVLLAACSDSEGNGSHDSTAATTSSLVPTTTLAAHVTVTSNIPFADAPPELTSWTPTLLDVYAPDGAQGVPLVVWFPPHGVTKNESRSLAQLATAIAERSAVVVVANWSQLEDPPEAASDPAALTALVRTGQSVAACAVSYAVSAAEGFGADPSRLVLGGELFGANAASMISLGTSDPFPGCRSTMQWHATGLVGVNDLWFALYPPFDAVAATAIDTLSPWTLLDQAPKIRTELVVTDAALAVSGRCEDRDAEWMAARDPSGALRDSFDAAGAFDDGCVDLADEATVMAALMTSNGFHADVVRLANDDGGTRSDDGAHVQQFGATDLAQLTDTVIAAAEGSATS